MEGKILQVAHFPAEDVAARLDGHYVGVGGEHFIQHRAPELTLCVFVKPQRDDILGSEGLPAHRVLVEFADVGQDVGDLIDCAIRRACLRERSFCTVHGSAVLK